MIRHETAELGFTLVPTPDDNPVGDARHHLRDFLTRESVGAERVAPAELVLSELVANAIAQGAPDIDVAVGIDGDAIRISVSHAATAGAKVGSGPAGGGWGLRVVDELATRWDERARPDGKPGTMVRAEILLV
jgi:two-component sensor histidine kinase